MTSVQEKTCVVSDFFAAASQGDVNGVLATFAEDAVSEDPVGSPRLSSNAKRRQLYESWAQMGLDSPTFTEDHVYDSGNSVAVKWSGTARRGEHEITFGGIDVFEIGEDGQIVRQSGYWDPSILMGGA